MQRRVRRRHRRLQQPARSAAPSAPSATGRTDPGCTATELQRPASRSNACTSRSKRTRSSSPATGSDLQAVSCCAPTGAFCNANTTWNSGWRSGARSGCQLLHQPLKRHVLVPIRSSVVRRTAASNSRKLSSGLTRTRITSVLTKNPISPSSCASCRFAIGEPTTMSSCPL